MNCLFISGVYLWFNQAWAERPSHGSQGCSSQGWWVGFPKVRGIGKAEISKHSHILAKVTVSCLALLCLSGLEPSSNIHTTLDLNLSPQRGRGPHLCSSYQPLFCSEARFLVLLASAKHCHTWVLTLTVLDAAGLNHGWLYRHTGVFGLMGIAAALWWAEARGPELPAACRTVPLNKDMSFPKCSNASMEKHNKLTNPSHHPHICPASLLPATMLLWEYKDKYMTSIIIYIW